MDIESIKQYISSVRWQFANKMPQIPHEYTMKQWEPVKEDTFHAFIMHIRENGYKGTFQGKEYTYFDVDGYQYWTMGDPLEKTILINRARLK